jgi:hypothetical protein
MRIQSRVTEKTQEQASRKIPNNASRIFLERGDSIGFIQNRRDAPLLLQWGEGDSQTFKILCFAVIPSLWKLCCLQEIPGKLCIQALGSWPEELRSIGTPSKRSIYELEGSGMVAKENYWQIASKYQA